MMSAPTAAQNATLAALWHGESFVQEMLAEYDRRRRLMVDRLDAVGLPASHPRGAFYAFPDIHPTGTDSTTFSEPLLEEGRVAFGACGEGFVRVCYASGHEQLERTLERLGRFVQHNR